MLNLELFFKAKSFLNKYIDWLVVGLVALLPWQARFLWVRFNGDKVWEYGSFSIYALEILIVLTAILFIFSRGGFKKFWSSFKNSWRSGWVFLPLVLWLGATFFWSQDLVASLTWLSYAITSIIFGWLLWQLPNEKKFWALAIASFIVSASVIASWFTQYVPASTWLGTGEHHPAFLGQSVVQFGEWAGTNVGERWLRAYGLLPHPNVAAGFVVVLLLSLWLLAHKLNNRRVVSISLFLSALSGAAVLATMSKSGALAIGALAIFWLILFRDSFWKFAVALFLGFGLFAYVAWPQVDARIKGTQTFEQFSRYERILGYEEAWQQKTWLGQGLSSSTKTMDKKVVLPPQPVHDVPLLILTELGLVGLALAFGTFLSLVYLSRVYKTRQFWLIFLTLLPLLAFDHYLLSMFAGLILWPVILGNFKEKPAKLVWD